MLSAWAGSWVRQRMHSLECYNNIFPHWGKISAVFINTLGCFYGLHGCWCFFSSQYAVFVFHTWKAIDFFLHPPKKSHFTCDMKGLAATGLTETFRIWVMSTLLGGWRRSAGLQPAFLFLPDLFMAFHKIVLITCCGTKCDQRCLRVRSPDSCSLLLPLLLCLMDVCRHRAGKALGKKSLRLSLP